jgi:hypothetical protein
MPAFSNGRLFDGLVLLLIGLYTASHGLALLRAQCYLLYLGAVLSKCLDADWWNGRFISAILEYHLPPAGLAFLQPLSLVGGWLTIAVEAACAGLLMRERTRNAGVALVVGFHTSLLLLLSEDFGTFYYTIALVTILVFLRLPNPVKLSIPSPLLTRLARTAVFGAIRSAPVRTGPFTVRISEREWVGLPALALILLTSRPVAAALIAAPAFASQLGQSHLRDAFLGTIVVAGFMTALGSRAVGGANEVGRITPVRRVPKGGVQRGT